jgi:peptidyl-prolyl cis-trans isomerase C
MNSSIARGIYRCLPALGILAAGLVIGGSGCQKKAPPTETTKTPTAGIPAALADKAVVTVNGIPVMESQVQKYMDLQYKTILARYAAQSPQLAAQQEKIFRAAAIQEFIRRQLLDEQAQAAGLTVTDQELMAEITRQLSSQKPPVTLADYQKYIADNGGDFEAMKGFLRQSMRCREVTELRAPGTPATEADAKKFYDANPQVFQVPEQVRASHILIKPADPNTDPNQAKAQAKAKAEELLKKVKEGADFATLAKENSDCPSKVKGGDLELFPRGKMVKPFEDAAFALKVGEVSDLVESPFGYHIIKVTEHHDPNQITFEEAKADLMAQLTARSQQEALNKYLQSLRVAAKVVYAAGNEPAAPKPPSAPRPSAPKLALPADANAKQ